MPSTESTRTYNEPKLSVARRIAQQMDDEYYKLHVELNNLKGELPLGEPAVPALHTMDQILSHVRMRERQILELRDEIKHIKDNRAPLFDEILKIAEGLDIQVVTTRSRN